MPTLGKAPWAGGSENLSLGPGKLEVSTQINTPWSSAVFTDLGGTDSIEFTVATKKVDLKESQAGDRPADKVVVSQMATLKAGLTRGFAERLNAIWQGFVTVIDSSGFTTQVKFAKRLGERDSEKFLWVRYTEYAKGTTSADPRRAVYFKAAPASDSVALKYDATSQRMIPIQLEAYEEASVTDTTGAPCYWWTGVATGAQR